MRLHSEGSNKIADWIQAERRATRRGVRRYGILSGILAVFVVLISAGMPGHFLWPWFGVPSVVLFACAFTPLLFFGGRLLWEWLEDLLTKNAVK